MESNSGGPSSQQESAAEIARKKVLAVYSSTLKSLKKDSSASTNSSSAPTAHNIVYSDHEEFDTFDDDSNVAGNDYEQINQPSSTSPYSPYQSSAPQSFSAASSTGDVSALKDLPVNQDAVNASWQQYHSAWQQYYQNYYNDYYTKAAQNYIATEKLKSERVATGQVHRKRRIKRLIPLFIVLTGVLVFLFLQYNRLIFAPIMAYVSPNSETVASSIEAIDPTITQAVSPDPRLIIPKLNIDVPVAFNISTSEVDAAMNHGVAQFKIPGANALPGEIGNVVISGHSAGDIYSSNPYKFIFSGLERLENGDLMYINYNSVRYTYQMTKSEVVEPTNVEALIYPTDKPILTLITCTPLGTSRYRLLITGEQISPAYESNPETPENPEPEPTPNDATMPANEPSLLERIFGN